MLTPPLKTCEKNKAWKMFFAIWWKQKTILVENRYYFYLTISISTISFWMKIIKKIISGMAINYYKSSQDKFLYVH